MRYFFAVFVLVAVGASAFPKGYMYYKPGTPGIMYVQYEKPGIGSRANAVSAFVAGGAGDAMSFVDDMQKDGQQFNANSVNAGILAEEPAPSIEYLPPITERNPVYDDFLDETDLLTRTEGDVTVDEEEEELRNDIADEMSVFQDEVTTDHIITEDDSVIKNAESVEESEGFKVYGVPDLEDTIGEKTIEEVKTTEATISDSDSDSTGEVKENGEETLRSDSLEDKKRVFEVYGVPNNEETKTQAKRTNKDIFVNKVSETNYERETTEVPRQGDESVRDTKSIDSVAAGNDSTFIVSELNPSINIITTTEAALDSSSIDSSNKKILRSSSKNRNYTPKRKSVYVHLDKEDEEASLPDSRQVALELERKEEEEEGADERQFPFGKTFFPINFGVNYGGAIAIANSFSTGKGGSSQSHAISYGAPSDANRSRQVARTSKADCNC